MKKIWQLFLFIVAPFLLFSQESKVNDSVVLKSKILNKNKLFAIYLPSGYEASQIRYPVLYLLHGGDGSQVDWIKQGNVKQTADSLISKGSSVPMIIVMPDAEMTFYLNNIEGKYQFEDYFFKELIPFIEKNYRCRTEKKYRAISGLSMGGFGSLLYSLHHPGLFNSCYAMSAAVRTDEEIKQMDLRDFQRRYETALGIVREADQRITDFWNQNSILYLMKKMPEDQKKAVRYFFECGDDDFLYTGNSMLHIVMRDAKIPHEYRVRDGGHTWDYWRTALPAALKFVSEGFR